MVETHSVIAPQPEGGPKPGKAAPGDRDPRAATDAALGRGIGPTYQRGGKEGHAQALFDVLVTNFLNLEELGVTWADLGDPVRLQQLKDQVMQTTGRLTEQRIGALLAALRRWLRYAADKQYTANAPTPLQLGEFLRMVAQGGPTAASSMYQALKWFRLNFGLPFNTDHWLTQPFRLLPPDHQVQQRTELQPWEMVNLLLMMKQSSGTHLLILTFLVWAAVSCVRFEHFQRSHYMEAHPQCLIFECSQGKARRKGARPPYVWAMPELEFQGLSLQRIVRDFVTVELDPTRNFLWPSLQLSADDLWEVTESILPGSLTARCPGAGILSCYVVPSLL